MTDNIEIWRAMYVAQTFYDGTSMAEGAMVFIAHVRAAFPEEAEGMTK